MPVDEIHSVHDLIAAHRAGRATITVDEALPVLGTVPRASFYRFLKSPDAPPGLCLALGRKRLISLSVFMRWLSIDLDAPDAKVEAATLNEAPVNDGTR